MYQVLTEMLQRSRADTVTTALNSDFLDLDPAQYQAVTHIVMDPSCSGTGMAKRGGGEEEPSQEHRLLILGRFYKLTFKI